MSFYGKIGRHTFYLSSNSTYSSIHNEYKKLFLEPNPIFPALPNIIKVRLYNPSYLILKPYIEIKCRNNLSIKPLLYPYDIFYDYSAKGPFNLKLTTKKKKKKKTVNKYSTNTLCAEKCINKEWQVKQDCKSLQLIVIVMVIVWWWWSITNSTTDLVCCKHTYTYTMCRALAIV